MLLAQKVYEWGYESVTLLMTKITTGKGPRKIIKAELVPITEDNATNAYGKNWDKWLGVKKPATPKKVPAKEEKKDERTKPEKK